MVEGIPKKVQAKSLKEFQGNPRKDLVQICDTILDLICQRILEGISMKDSLMKCRKKIPGGILRGIPEEIPKRFNE